MCHEFGPRRTHIRAQIPGTIDPVFWLRVEVERRTGAGVGKGGSGGNRDQVEAGANLVGRDSACEDGVLDLFLLDLLYRFW